MRIAASSYRLRDAVEQNAMNFVSESTAAAVVAKKKSGDLCRPFPAATALSR